MPIDLQSIVFDRFTNPAYVRIQCLHMNTHYIVTPPRTTLTQSLGGLDALAKASNYCIRLLSDDRFWSRQRDSNPRPAVYKTAALATELCRQKVCTRGNTNK